MPSFDIVNRLDHQEIDNALGMRQEKLPLGTILKDQILQLKKKKIL